MAPPALKMVGLVLVQLALAVAAAAQPQPDEPCERLLADYGELARADCRCSDSMPSASMSLSSSSSPSSSSAAAAAASQLHCAPNTLAEFIALAPTLAVAANNHQVDYLNIITRLARRRKGIGEPAATRRRLAIDHISLELVGRVASPKELEEQMIDLIGLINATHLQFLSILVAPAASDPGAEPEEDNPQPPNAAVETGEEIKLAHLLAQLPQLARLELSLGAGLNLDSSSSSSSLLPLLDHSKPLALKWLTLGAPSGSRLLLKLPQRLAPAFAELEHLGLESGGGGGSLEELALATRFAGLNKLGSLNLANNKLASFQRLLFGSRPPQEVQWPALNQLDLSHNRFAALEHRTAQFILQSMPNLQQLYLQHNQLLRLNLNSLLRAPSPEPFAFVGFQRQDDWQDWQDRRQATLSSSLEYLDLSHNRLAALIGMQAANSSYSSNQGQPPRVKSINLAHNQLASILLPVDSIAATRLELEGEQDSSLVSFDMSNHKLNSSLCDFLSPLQSANQQQELLNEILLQNNRLLQIWSRDFAGSACRDVQIVRLSSNYIASIEPRAFYELVHLEHLDLGHNLLVGLQAETFAKTVRLRILNLSYNKLTDLSRGLFSHLNQLEELSLNDNELRELPAGLLENNQQLLVLDLSNNKLIRLERSMFASLKQLQVLNLNTNRLLQFSHHLFDAQSALPTSPIVTQKSAKAQQKLSTKHQNQNQSLNQMRPLRVSGKKSEKQARKRQNRQAHDIVGGGGNNLLTLTGNQLEQFQVDKCHPFVQNVQLLRLNSNKLRSLVANQFKCFQSLRRLHLEQNLISQLDGKAFGGDGAGRQLELEYIDLSGNQLASVPAGTFAQLAHLRHLSLDSNRLISFSFSLALVQGSDSKAPGTAVLAEPTLIESINLSGNQALQLDAADLLLFLESICASSSGAARPLALRLANIEAIAQHDHNPLNMTNPCFNLDLLDLSNTKRLVNLPLRGAPIAKLNLSGTNYGLDKVLSLLETTDSDDLVSLSLNGNGYNQSDAVKLVENLQVSHLSLSNNRIERWPFSGGGHQGKLISLDLSSNYLEQFIAAAATASMERYEFRELEVLNLSSNALMGLVEQQPPPSLTIAGLRLLMPQLRSLDLSHNRLAWLPARFLDGLRRLERLRLDHNQLEQLSAPHLVGAGFHLDLSHNHRRDFTDPEPAKENLAYSSLELDSDGLILFDTSNNYSHSQSLFQCQSIDQFISREIHPQRRQENHSDEPNELAATTRAHQDDLEEAGAGDRCRRLMEMSQFVRSESNHLDHSFGLFRSISPTSSRFSFLNLRGNSLRVQDLHFAGPQAGQIIQLDLSSNQVSHLPQDFCPHLGQLKSLDLSNNQLGEFPKHVILCSKLAYLDLSYNQIASLPEDFSSLKLDSAAVSQLAVVKLNHNSLTELRHQMLAALLGSLPALRYLDLRSNWAMKALGARWWRPLPFVIRVDFAGDLGAGRAGDLGAPHLEASKESMLINSSSLLASKHQSTGAQTRLRVSHQVLKSTGASANKRFFELDTNRPIHYIKFCTLPNQTLTQVCLEVARTGNGAEEDGEQPDRCIKLRRPPRVGSCVTDLAGQKHDSSQLVAGPATSPRPSLAPQEQDLVLNFIDSLKRYWLLLKEADVNELLVSVSNIQSDSVLARLGSDGAYPIYSLTMVKVAIVGGALAIICLLVSMFTLLANQDAGSATGGSPHGRRGSESDAAANENTSTHLTSSNNSTSSSSDGSNNTNNTQLTAKTAPSSSSSLSVTNKSAATPETVVERRASQSLDAGQLAFQHQCPTPSSSLAPSSVETAETLQAVESIQSGSQAGQTDAYSDYQQQQVATVMRMVKSNSANFDFDATGRPLQAYGTLGDPRRAGSHNLRSRLRALEKQAIYPSESYYQPATQYSTYVPAESLVYVTAEESPPPPPPPLEPQDAQTLVGVALSAGLNSSLGRQVSPAANSNPASLCRYHRFQQQQQQQVSLASDNVILEEQPESLGQAQPERCGQELLPPPPPASRAIEALENPLLLLTAHQHQSQLSHNQHHHHHHRHYH